MSFVSLDLDLSTHRLPAAGAQSARPLERPECAGHALGRFRGGGGWVVMEGNKQKIETGERKI